MISILILCCLLVLLIIVQHTKQENFAWSCTWIPEKDYWQESWLMGTEGPSRSITADTIRSLNPL